MTSLIYDKQGNMKLIGFIIMALIGLMAIGIVSIFLYLVNSAFFDEFNATDLNNSATGQVEDSIMGATLMFDWIIVILLVFSIIGIAILGWHNTSPPIFFILLLFFTMFLGAVSFLLDYIFYQIVSNSAFSSIINYYPNTILICTNLHWLALVMILVGGYTSYTSSRRQG